MAGIGGTVANLLSLCKLLNNELKVASGEPDETRMILALNEGQRYLELLAAQYPRALQQVTTVATVANTETTAKPATLLRLDSIWLLDSNSRAVRKLERIDEVGGHVPDLPWPFLLSPDAVSLQATGAPIGYYASWDQFYWLPRPDGVHTARIYGLLEKDDWTIRTDDVNYPKRARLAIASFAVKLHRLGVDDDVKDLDTLAAQTFVPLLRTLSNLDRSGPQGRAYTEFHTT